MLGVSAGYPLHRYNRNNQDSTNFIKYRCLELLHTNNIASGLIIKKKDDITLPYYIALVQEEIRYSIALVHCRGDLSNIDNPLRSKLPERNAWLLVEVYWFKPAKLAGNIN
jgi:hypothetical protein